MKKTLSPEEEIRLKELVDKHKLTNEEDVECDNLMSRALETKQINRILRGEAKSNEKFPWSGPLYPSGQNGLPFLIHVYQVRQWSVHHRP